jgi:hypothetical protein
LTGAWPALRPAKAARAAALGPVAPHHGGGRCGGGAAVAEAAGAQQRTEEPPAPRCPLPPPAPLPGPPQPDPPRTLHRRPPPPQPPFQVRTAQGLVHMGKGLLGLSPYHTERQLLSGVALAGLLAVLFSCEDVKSTVVGTRGPRGREGKGCAAPSWFAVRS